MMNKNMKKLVLVKTSVRSLSAADLGQVNGGSLVTHLAITAMAGGNGGAVGGHKSDGVGPIPNF